MEAFTDPFMHAVFDGLCLHCHFSQKIQHWKRYQGMTLKNPLEWTLTVTFESLPTKWCIYGGGRDDWENKS